MTNRLFLWMLLLAAPLAAQDTTTAKVKAEVTGIHVNKAPYQGDQDLAPNMEPAPGTKLSVLLTVPNGGIIRMDEHKSKLTKFSDDKGTNLLAAKAAKESFFNSPIGSFPKITKDQKGCLVELQAMTTPAAGARTLEVEASVSLAVGSDQETVKQEKVEAKKDGAFKAGGIEFKITEAGKNTFGDDPMKIGLESKEGLKIAKIRFLDAGGKEIESRLGSRGSMSFGGDATYSWEYTLKQMATTVTVEVTLWKKVTIVDVPVKLSVSLGF